jgi:hypothetical protein
VAPDRVHHGQLRRPAGRPVPGLLTSPANGLWVAERLAWLPVFAIVLSALWLAFCRAERG